MSIAIAAEWEEMSGTFYRKRNIFDMPWQGVELSHNIVACSPYGGPIAITRDPRKLLILDQAKTVNMIHVYTSAGRILSKFPFDQPGGVLVSMSWTDEQSLVCVVEDGSIFQYSVHGDVLASRISLGKECWEQGVLDVIPWGSGLIALTSSYQLFAITDFKDPRVLKLPLVSLVEPPLCMAVLEPRFSASGLVEVLLAVGSTVLAVRPHGIQDQSDAVGGAVLSMAVSPNGSFVACFKHDGTMAVLSSDFSKTVSLYDSQVPACPDAMQWCGTDSVVLHWSPTDRQTELVMVGPFGDTVVYSYEDRAPGRVVLVSELDGLRLVTNTAVEFISRVPDPLVHVFGIGSTHPATLLFEAWDLFHHRVAKADDNLRVIGSSMGEAVETCIQAAGHEFDPHLQKKLLQAARYGTAFCRDFPHHRMMETCKALRVLNCIRAANQAGMPLTFTQYQDLTPPVVMARLVNAHHHLLALRLCQYLSLPQSTVLINWAAAKIVSTSESEDDTLLPLLVSKLKMSPTASFASVAAKAYKAGRPQLAARLLDYEPRSAEQIPLLTSIGEGERALGKAVECGDTDLMFFAMFHLWKTRPEKEVVRILQSRPAARDLYLSYAKENEPEMLKKFHAIAGQPQGLAEALLREAWAAGQGDGGLGARGSALGSVRLKVLEEAGELYGQAKEHGFHARSALEQRELLKAQQELEVVTGRAIFVDTSVSDTIRTCISLGGQWHKAANKIKADFKVPEKRFYWLKIKALAVAKDWTSLEQFSKEKRPPVGFRPFFESCVEEGSYAEAAKYIPKLTDLRERAEAYARIGMVEEAAEAAAQAKDGELFGRLKSTFASQNAAAAALFDSLKERIMPLGK